MATAKLSESLDTQIKIGRIDYRFFNKLEVTDLFIGDQSNDTLLHAHQLIAHFDFTSLFRRQFVFSNIEIDQLFGHFSTDSTGRSNFAFLFEREKEKRDTTYFDLSLNKLLLTNSRIQHQRLPLVSKKETFDTNNLYITDLNAVVNIRVWNNDTIIASVQRFSAKEHSGLAVKNMRLSLQGSPAGFRFPKFTIELPASVIDLSNSSLTFQGYEALSRFQTDVSMRLQIHETSVNPSDLKSFIPEIQGVKDNIYLEALVTGRIPSLRFEKISLRHGETFEFDASLDVSGLPNLAESFFFGNIRNFKLKAHEMKEIIAQIDKNSQFFSPEILRLGNIHYSGNITGFLSDLVAFGTFRTDIGNISSDIALQFENNLSDLSFSGRLRTSNLHLGRMLNIPTLGRLSVDLHTKGTKKANQDMRGTLTAQLRELEFNRYLYTNATLDGRFDGTEFEGEISIKDENMDAEFTGMLDFRNPRIPVFDFELKVLNTNLSALNLIEGYAGSRLSFNGKTNISGSTLDNLNGYLHLTDIVFENQNRTLNANEFHFTSLTRTNHTQFLVRSDFINGSFDGNFKYSTIGNTFRRLLSQYLPALSYNNGSDTHDPNVIRIDLRLENIHEITEVLQIPYALDGVATISGNIDETKNVIDLLARAESVKSKNYIFDNLNLRVETVQGKLQLTSRGRMIDKNDELMNVFLWAEAANNDLAARLIWQNNREVTVAGEIDTKTTFRKKNNDQVVAQTQFNPTQVIISDSIWNIRPSNIVFESDSLIRINQFLFESNQQYFRIHGVASNKATDSVLVDMNELNLDFVMQLMQMDGIRFGGITTGNLKISNLLKEPVYLANIDIQNFSINKERVGNAKVTTHWDNTLNALKIESKVMLNERDTAAIVQGVFVPSADSLDLNIDAHNVSVRFLNRYFEGVVSNFQGFGRGKVRVYGPTDQIAVLADVFVTGGQGTIDQLQTTYWFNDRVVLTRNQILLQNLTLFDVERNQARANGVISHDGTFSDLRYDARIQATNIQVMNTGPEDDSFFYGKAYMGGSIHIHGNEEEANIIVNGVSRPRTHCFLSLGSTASVLENDFIRFVNRNVNLYPQDDIFIQPRTFVDEREFNVKVDMQIEVTPDAEMDIIIDPASGDKLTGRGRGNLRIRFDTFSDVDVYGSVALEQGQYHFSLQTVIRKEFRITEGSSITFSGSPYDAQVNIMGYYPLTASLADLIEREELMQITSRSTVPVHCLLHLTENLMSPRVSLNIDLPASDESVKSRVRSIINTEEMMNRQILYLLLFNRFFTPGELRSNVAANFNEGWSFAAATVSSQINNLIQNSLNTDVLSLGFDWQKSDIATDEIKAQVLIQPNHRLIINGNIGYRNDNISDNRFIGDFDLEYKLLESGKLRFTAYNHTIDRAQLREAKTTQGVGLIYREEFNDLRDMFAYYWGLTKRLLGIKPEE